MKMKKKIVKWAQGKSPAEEEKSLMRENKRTNDLTSKKKTTNLVGLEKKLG